MQQQISQMRMLSLRLLSACNSLEKKYFYDDKQLKIKSDLIFKKPEKLFNFCIKG